MAWEWFGLLAVTWEGGKLLCIINGVQYIFLDILTFVCDDRSPLFLRD